LYVCKEGLLAIIRCRMGTANSDFSSIKIRNEHYRKFILSNELPNENFSYITALFRW